MLSISTNLHFGKILLEKISISDVLATDIDLLSYVIGLASPKTIFDELDEYHTLDEDGNIDVREFYEKFNIKELPLEARSFVFGYYGSLWLEEYYKFNTSKLTIHNREGLSDDELILSLSNTVKYYDMVSVGDFYKKIRDSILAYDSNLNLNETKHINFNKVKEILADYFNESIPLVEHKNLIDQNEYNSFIDKSCSKFLKSL